MKSPKKKQVDMYKMTVKILIFVLILAVVINVVYAAGIFIRRSLLTDNLSEAVDTAVAECTEQLNDFGLNETQQEYIDLYMQNMDNCDTELERAYIANAMITYAISTTNLTNSNNLTDIYNNGGIGQSKSYIVDELSAISQQLQNAIYDYTVYNENE